MNAPAPSGSAPARSHHGELLLEAAAKLLDRRMVAIRSGSPALHVMQELELASRAIRQLAVELARLEEQRDESDDAELPGVAPMQVRAILRGPPVLTRVNRAPGPQVAPASLDA